MKEWERSRPDIKVFLPNSDEYEGDNEHFLVFPTKNNDRLLAIWTQSSREGFGDNHIVMAESFDGEAWSKPWYVVGAKKGEGRGKQASWAFPIVADTGRIYIFFTKDIGAYDLDSQTSGVLAMVYSDDCGRSFKDGGNFDIPKNMFDNPDCGIPINFIVWQKPILDSKGRFLAGFTRWSSVTVKKKVHEGWYSRDSRVHFIRFDNIRDGVEPSEIKLTFLPENGEGLSVPFPDDDSISVAQEPSIVLLPDNSLFCTMRTFTGYIWYSVSCDDGENWRMPEPLRYTDNGEKIKQPIASCPVFPMSDGRYILVFHNNNGYFEDFLPKDALYNRRPAYISKGDYLMNSHQKLAFDAPMLLCDTDGIPVGPKGTTEIATYPSFTEFNKKRILWYPDRKYYLLGKYIE